MKNEERGNKYSRIGLGCGGMVNTPGSTAKDQSIYAMHAAIDAGIRMFNTAEFYGCGESEAAIGEALSGGRRDSVYISDKFGAMVGPDGNMYGLDVQTNHVKNHIAYSLKRLRTDYIDLYEPGRIDLAIPVEETIGAVADLVDAGYVREIGLTQVDAQTLRRAEKVHHISYVELEYSLFNRSIEQELLKTARELNIKVVAFGTLAHGLLSGSCDAEHAKRLEGRAPIFAKENLEQNLRLVDNLRTIAKAKNTEISQLAIAWMLHKGSDITPLVGSRQADHILHALEAEKIELTETDMEQIEAAVPPCQVAGLTFRQMEFRNGMVVHA